MKRRAEPAWPADKVERRAVATLVPYAKNARSHSREQVAQIAASVQEWGWTVPVLIDEAGGLIAGHGRVLAAQLLGLDTVPVMVAAGWSDTQKRAYIIADNKLALNAGWDPELLRGELTDLQTGGADLALMGFSPDEVAAILVDKTVGLTDPDDAPEPPANPVSVLGDVWIMGRHRLLCGDSTRITDVDRLMAGALADLCFTSPPYGQQRDYKTGIADWDALMQGVFAALPVKREAQILVNLGMIHRDGEWMPYWDGWIEWMRAAGWRRFGWYVWDKGAGLPGDWNGRLAPSHEWLFHFNRVAERARKTKEKQAASVRRVSAKNTMRRADGTLKPFGDPASGLGTHKIPDSVIRIEQRQPRGPENAHPAVFPVDLVSEMLTAFSDPDDLVFEPFCGSGTQLISAQKNGRSCFAMEIAPAYVDVAVRRWQNFTGQTATLEGDGRSYAEVAAARLKTAA